MREAIGGTWLFGLVITFIMFFASFLAVSINYSKAFNIKNNVVDLISKYEGNNCNARKKIGEYLNDSGYLVAGTCDSEYTPYGLDGNKISGSKKGYFCVSKEKISGTQALIEKNYYRVVIFFKIDLPLIGNLTTFKIKGETESIYFPKDENICK